MSFSLVNQGTGDLNISSLTLTGDDFEMATPFMSAVITPGWSHDIEIRFDPHSAGIKASTVTIVSDDADEPTFTFTLTGSGVAVPDINLKRGTSTLASGAGSYDFGEISCDGNGGTASSYVTFTIENLGVAPLTINGISVTGSDFDKTDAISSTVAALSSTTFTIRFDPVEVGSPLATVAVTSNDPDEGTYTFLVTGVGTGPEINIRQASRNLPSGSGSYAFGSVSADGDGGLTSDYVPFTIENLGNRNLTFSSVAMTGSDFDRTNIPTGIVLPGASTTLSIRFDPLTTGAKTATVTLGSNDYDESSYTFTVTGTGVAQPEINVKAGSTDDRPLRVGSPVGLRSPTTAFVSPLHWLAGDFAVLAGALAPIGEGATTSASNGDIELTIPDDDATGVTDAVTLTGHPDQRVDALSVLVRVSHADLRELRIELISPSEDVALLYDGAAGDGGTALDAVFDLLTSPAMLDRGRDQRRLRGAAAPLGGRALPGGDGWRGSISRQHVERPMPEDLRSECALVSAQRVQLLVGRDVSPTRREHR